MQDKSSRKDWIDIQILAGLFFLPESDKIIKEMNICS
jgi:hypothetical protein